MWPEALPFLVILKEEKNVLLEIVDILIYTIFSSLLKIDDFWILRSASSFNSTHTVGQ